MKKVLIAAAAVLVIGGGTTGALAAKKKGGTVKPSTIWCSDVIVTFPSDHPGPYVQQGTTLTASNTGDTCQGTVVAYKWKRNGAFISGATSQTYTTTSADAGATITARIEGTIQSEDSINSAHVLGASKLDDEFNNGSGDPSHTTWSAASTVDVYGVTFNGFANINEAPGGYMYIEGAFGDNDGDGDTASTDTDSTSEPGDSAADDWSSGIMSTNATQTGARYVESRDWFPCVDSDTGWTTSYGWESALFQTQVGHGEIDILGNHSKTTWGSPAGQNNGDYVPGPGWITWDETVANGAPSTFDGDHDGDSISSDTDTPVTPAGDGDEPDSDADDTPVAETSDTWLNGGATTPTSSLVKQSTKVCGVWNVYGALIQAHSVQFYLNGNLIYTNYSSATYGTPNMGLGSSYDLTTLPMITTYALRLNQDPPNNTAAFFLESDYIRSNALS